MNKSFVTNLLAVILIIIGYFSPVAKEQFLSIGFFAFSGAITNWLAVYMLFEKIPFLYGSGIIPNRFQEFKKGIKSLIINQFFNKKNIDKFFKQEEEIMVDKFKFDKVVEVLDYNKLFNGLIDTVMESPLGGMLGMFGGKEALTPLKDPFIEKMKDSILNMTKEKEFLDALDKMIMSTDKKDNIQDRLEEVIDKRLEELTPQMVKDIIQEMMRIHLGWLVVWGGVFGGIIGLIMSFVQ